MDGLTSSKQKWIYACSISLDPAEAGSQNEVKVEKFMLMSQGKTDNLKDKQLGFLNEEQKSWDKINRTAVHITYIWFLVPGGGSQWVMPTELAAHTAQQLFTPGCQRQGWSLTSQ